MLKFSDGKGKGNTTITGKKSQANKITQIKKRYYYYSKTIVKC